MKHGGVRGTPPIEGITMRNAARWIVCAVALSTTVAHADEMADMAAKVKEAARRSDACPATGVGQDQGGVPGEEEGQVVSSAGGLFRP